ncbi:hypothetical protein Ccar_16265 [Clostridium carboxidivorans P7]|uniref:Uncharacterized protein n=1 Tax=Clostridium carboxidivorans P7 TaxID=536227 RepID=C6PT13_9CLOT|nr:hypothetical protein [Clostridium carboxidivorans]AKN32332.1 hypothetical protein Ccar_16265 [Clostridium carboxidivorans P7]EET87648.1 hypothetical protein CcarbDRAFT_1930 [Clostridium carboxidivorans P7]
MIIEKSYELWKDDKFNKHYIMTFRVLDLYDRSVSCFIDGKAQGILEEGAKWIDINNLDKKEFLNEKNIEFIIEKNEGIEQIIPVGLIDFIIGEKYCFTELHLCKFGGDSLYKSNQIVKNIQRAIEIQYEAKKFADKFAINGNKEEMVLT